MKDRILIKNPRESVFCDLADTTFDIPEILIEGPSIRANEKNLKVAFPKESGGAEVINGENEYV